MVFIMDASKPDIVKEPSSYKEENKGFIDHATAHECIHNFTIIVASTRGGKLKVVIVTVLPPRSVYTGGNSESSFLVGPPASSGGQTAESLQSKKTTQVGTYLLAFGCLAPTRCWWSDSEGGFAVPASIHRPGGQNSHNHNFQFSSSCGSNNDGEVIIVFMGCGMLMNPLFSSL